MSTSPFTITLLGSVFILLVSAVVVRGQDVPAAGVYIALQPQFVQSIAEQMSIAIADTVNTDTSTPPQSGQQGKVHYELKNFAFDTDFGQPQITIAGGGGSSAALTIEWNNLDFLFVMDYHVQVNPIGESGWIQIVTPPNQGQVSLTIQATIDVSGSTVSVTNANAFMNFQQGAIMIYVQCTDTICLIPTSDIANAAAQGFVPAFQNLTATAFNMAAQQYVNTIALNIPITLNYGSYGPYQLSVGLQGELLPVPGDNGLGIVLAMNGAVSPVQQGVPVAPPFSPTDTLPDSVFSAPQVSMVTGITAYSPLTLLWALTQLDMFDLTITQQQMPQLNLNTSSTMWLLLAPGLVKFPNMGIVIRTSVASPFGVSIGSNGVAVSGILKADFSLVNASMTIQSAWTFTVGVSALAFVDLQFTSPNIVANASFSNWNANVTLLQSQIGTIFTFGLGSLLSSALQSTVQPMVIQVPVPPASSTFPLQLMGLTYQYIPKAVAMSTVRSRPVLNIVSPYPQEPCGQNGQGEPCPESSTCCQWNSGWGCCTLPNASCCPDGGCCPQNWVCYQGACYPNSELHPQVIF